MILRYKDKSHSSRSPLAEPRFARCEQSREIGKKIINKSCVRMAGKFTYTTCRGCMANSSGGRESCSLPESDTASCAINVDFADFIWSPALLGKWTSQSIVVDLIDHTAAASLIGRVNKPSESFSAGTRPRCNCRDEWVILRPDRLAGLVVQSRYRTMS